ncbi:uncharacterized protein JN550_012559 [Neoarthrinium moseri]|uniref:uncharacterized protein n=1 Tax=Neoarthrinium moseri TaxID=1658444 RepID=UPI001FDD408E|nr:uncharacterized protein JN550_012559 [Neoarthrinium moseri]KAI1858512.1 hypothetical protein JN550_012559 [Neoarthrinium moseri]
MADGSSTGASGGSQAYTPYTIRLTPTKGYGMFATQQIQQGACILEESPLVVFLSAEEGDQTPWHMALRIEVAALSPSDKAKFFSLHCCVDELEDEYKKHVRQDLFETGEFDHMDSPALDAELELVSREIRIRNTNCTQFASRSESGCGIYYTYSRINHSCVPNAYGTCDAANNMYLRALRPISLGEEITISYHEQDNLPRDERAKMIESWHFTCSCPACDGPERDKHEILRMDMMDIEGTLHGYDLAPQRQGGPLVEQGLLFLPDENAALLAIRYIGVLAAAGIKGPSKTEAYERASKYCTSLGSFQEAVNLAELAHRHECIVHGEDMAGWTQKLLKRARRRLEKEAQASDPEGGQDSVLLRASQEAMRGF